MSTYKPQERDVIKVSLQGAPEFYTLLQYNLRDKYDFVSLSDSERQRIMDDCEVQLSSPLNRKNLDSRVYLSWNYEINGKFSEAINILEGAVNIAEASDRSFYHPSLYAQLIYLYERQGRYEEASSSYEKIAKPRPAVCLRVLPNDAVLICGCSTQSNFFVENFDEKSNFGGTEGGIHLDFLGRIRVQDLPHDLKRPIAQITKEQHVRLLEKLREYLKDSLREYLKMPDIYNLSSRL